MIAIVLSLALSGLLLIVLILWGIRIEVMHNVRIAFIDDGALYPLYKRLPSYSQMVHQPKHWHRWTVAQWHNYAAQRMT